MTAGSKSRILPSPGSRTRPGAEMQMYRLFGFTLALSLFGVACGGAEKPADKPVVA